MPKGTLDWRWETIDGKKGRFPFITYLNEKKGKEVSVLIKRQSVLDANLINPRNGPTEVEFNRDQSGEICAVFLPGQAIAPQVTTSPPNLSQPAAQNRMPGDFHNPYNFIPAISRFDISGQLGDLKPTGHDRFHPDCYSGRLRIKLTTKTPLLSLDTSDVSVSIDEGKHKTFHVLRDSNGNPRLPVTSIKGMLRAAFEAVTNSRMGVLEDHDAPLAYRMSTQEGLGLIPARIEKQPNGEFNIVLYRGTSSIQTNGKPNGLMYAAWLPKYRKVRDEIIEKDWKGLDTHGNDVWVEIQKEKKIKIKNGKQNIIEFWKVIDISKTKPSSVSPQKKWVKGYVCINNHNIDNKHDERVFFEDLASGAANLKFLLTPEVKKRWEQLIKNYQDIHRDEASPPAQAFAVFSRHVGKATPPAQETKIEDGTLCYARLENGKPVELFPVMISRKLFPSAPIEFLDDTLKPADSFEKLSPADRVFGWVGKGGSGKAYRGHVRIGTVICTSDQTCVRTFNGQGRALAILGQPKPQQARFYLAGDREGNSQQVGQTTTEAGYHNPKEKSLRGRKVYPHHREFREGEAFRAGGKRDSQNRSITEWVQPETCFEFDLDFLNLSKVELGALLYLLTLPEGMYHRYGGGKPLGFGSVRLELVFEKSEVRDYQKVLELYTDLIETPATPTENEIKEFVQAFKDALKGSYKSETPSFLLAFERAAAGFDDDKPIHYPRLKPTPDPEGKSFEWFVQNSSTRSHYTPGHTLPDLIDDQGLPFR